MFHKKLESRIRVLEARQELMHQAVLHLTEIVNDLINKLQEVELNMAKAPAKPMGKSKPMPGKKKC